MLAGTKGKKKRKFIMLEGEVNRSKVFDIMDNQESYLS